MTTPFKYQVREAIVVTLHLKQVEEKDQQRYRFFTDTDKDKLDFVQWYLEMQDDKFFRNYMQMRGIWNKGLPFIYFQANFKEYSDDDCYKKEELVLPVAMDWQRLALFEQLIQGADGPLACVCGFTNGAPNGVGKLLFDKVRARVPISKVKDEPDDPVFAFLASDSIVFDEKGQCMPFEEFKSLYAEWRRNNSLPAQPLKRRDYAKSFMDCGITIVKGAEWPVGSGLQDTRAFVLGIRRNDDN